MIITTYAQITIPNDQHDKNAEFVYKIKPVQLKFRLGMCLA